MTNRRKRLNEKMSNGDIRARRRFVKLMKKKYDKKQMANKSLTTLESIEKDVGLQYEGMTFAN